MTHFYKISENTKDYSSVITLDQQTSATLRPLMHSDVDSLAQFLQKLSPKTRFFFSYDSFDRAMAQSLCDSINKYDKLRFILELDASKEIVGIFEFSMDLVKDDIERFSRAGIELNVPNVCRYGPALLDEFQGKGIAQKVFERLVPIVLSVGKDTIILYGGVKSSNSAAIKHYLKLGFIKSAEFINQDGEKCLDMVLQLV